MLKGRVCASGRGSVFAGIVTLAMAGASFDQARAQEGGAQARPDCSGASAYAARQALGVLRESRVASPTAQEVMALRNRFAENLSATGCFDRQGGRALSVGGDDTMAPSLLAADARFARSTVALLEGVARDARIWGGRPQNGFSAVVALFRSGENSEGSSGGGMHGCSHRLRYGRDSRTLRL